MFRQLAVLALVAACAALERPPRRPCAATSRAAPRCSGSALAAVQRPGSAFAAATGGGFAESGLAPQTSVSMPKELREYVPPSKTTCSKCVPNEEELKRLSVGYKRLQFLLDNWEAETTVCIKGCKGKAENCGCERSPLVVQNYMGFKSMNDPLFRADQLMIRAEPLAEKQFEKYAALVDRWIEKADDGNVMAYVSSWGEANPGGGKDEVARYLEKSRKGVVESAQILKSICEILGVSTA